jgi:hypothetical protein
VIVECAAALVARFRRPLPMIQTSQAHRTD